MPKLVVDGDRIVTERTRSRPAASPAGSSACRRGRRSSGSPTRQRPGAGAATDTASTTPRSRSQRSTPPEARARRPRSTQARPRRRPRTEETCQRPKAGDPPATAVTQTPSALASRCSTARPYQPARSSCASGERTFTRATTSAGASDDTLFATADGKVKFGSRHGRRLVDVLPLED